MSTRNRLSLMVLLLGSSTMLVRSAQEGPNLGIVATPEQVAAWSLTIFPDGTGLPEGSGTAKEGELTYVRRCLSCHGPNGDDGPNNKLVGGHGSILSETPLKTVGSYWPYATTLFDYVRRSMPMDEPLFLTNDEVYAVTAYLLMLNDIIDSDTVMNAETLPQVKMPNAENFIWAYPEIGK